MSLIIFPTENQDILLPILRNPKLFKLTNGQDSRIPLEKVQIDSTFTYLAIALKDKVIGYFSLKTLTHMIIEGHIAILPEYWGTAISAQAMEEGAQYIFDHTSYRKIVTFTPGNCTKVINLLKKCEYKQSGCIQEGIIYNNQLTSLLIFELDLNRGKHE